MLAHSKTLDYFYTDQCYLKVPMKWKFFPHNKKISRLKYTISKFEFPTIKIVDFTSAQSWPILPSKMAFESLGQNVTRHQRMTSVCVIEILQHLPDLPP